MSTLITKKKVRNYLLVSSKILYFNELLKLTEKMDYIVIAYSGGKDSTLLLHFTLEHVIKNKASVVIVSSDTLVENPVVKTHIYDTLNSIDRFLSGQRIFYQIKIVKPEPNETFWVHLIGRGYPLPHRRFRWCQRVLKIKPVERFLRSLEGNPALLLGHRLDESSLRKRTVLGRGNYGKFRVLMPLLYFTEEDVWNFLMTEEPIWNGSFGRVIELYRDARGECILIGKNLQSKTNGCGNRFGCWVCTMVKDDKSMANLIRNKKYKYLQPYYEFRKWLIEFCNSPENRSPYTRRGSLAKNGMGCLTYKARERILKEVLSLEKVTENKIIDQKEMDLIINSWSGG